MSKENNFLDRVEILGSNNALENNYQEKKENNYQIF